MLYRSADEEKRREIEIELEKPLPGQARKMPTPEERAKVNQEWSTFMQSVG